MRVKEFKDEEDMLKESGISMTASEGPLRHRVTTAAERSAGLADEVNGACTRGIGSEVIINWQ